MYVSVALYNNNIIMQWTQLNISSHLKEAEEELSRLQGIISTHYKNTISSYTMYTCTV